MSVPPPGSFIGTRDETTSMAPGEWTRREFLQTSVAAGGGLVVEMAGYDRGVAEADAAGSTADMLDLSLTINRQQHVLSVDPRTTLLDLIREHLGLTGTKKGCNHGQCGACTVIVGGRRVNSCLILAAMAEGDPITTIEGLAEGETPHPLQSAFVRHDAFQCGFCTPGQICSAAAMLDEFDAGMPSVVTSNVASTPRELTEIEIRERMSGNICRCGAYSGIVAAISDAAATRRTREGDSG